VWRHFLPVGVVRPRVGCWRAAADRIRLRIVGPGKTFSVHRLVPRVAPAGRRQGQTPGVLALHDHGGFKYFGKEKISDGPGETASVLGSFRDAYDGGRAFANEQAR